MSFNQNKFYLNLNARLKQHVSFKISFQESNEKLKQGKENSLPPLKLVFYSF